MIHNSAAKNTVSPPSICRLRTSCGATAAFSGGNAPAARRSDRSRAPAKTRCADRLSTFYAAAVVIAIMNHGKATRSPIPTATARTRRGCQWRPTARWRPEDAYAAVGIDHTHAQEIIAPGRDHRAELSSTDGVHEVRPSGSHIAPSRSWRRKPPTRIPATASTMMAK